MKNSAVRFLVVVLLFGSVAVAPAAQAQIPGRDQISSLLVSIVELTHSVTNLLASVIAALPEQPRSRDAAKSIEAQVSDPQVVVDKTEEGETSASDAAEQESTKLAQKITKTISKGATGNDVRALQKYLASRSNGTYSEDIVTGYYGPLTEQAVKDFQKELGLDPIGIVGPQTRDIINEELLEGTSSVAVPSTLTLPQRTVGLLNIIGELKTARSERIPAIARRLSEYAASRKEAVLGAMKTDPEGVFRNALPSSALSGVSEDVLRFVEQRKVVRGSFEYLHIHWGDFETGQVENQYFVKEDGTNKRYRVHLNGVPPSLTDDAVEVDGVVLGDEVAATERSIRVIERARSNIPPKPAPPLSFWQKAFQAIFPSVVRAQSSTLPAQVKVAVIMFNWQNDPRTTFTENSARGTFFTNSKSSNSYYRENSFGQMELVGKYRTDGDVFGWVTIPYDNTDCRSMYGVWASAAEAQLQASGVDLSGYNAKTFVFPSVSCGWSGTAYVGGAYSWINGTSLGTITHELGHNFGAYHASSWLCTEGGTRVSVSQDANCALKEYGDPYDVMGKSGAMRHMNNYHKGISRPSLNWLDPANTHTIDRLVSPDAVYEITPIERASGGIQSLRIPRSMSGSGSVNDYYYLEFREPLGFDQSVSPYATNGVTIRVAPPYGISWNSKLIDASPETASFDDAPLALGRTFTDPYRAISVTVLGVSSSSASVRVSFGPVPCGLAHPTITLSPKSASVFPGQSAAFAYTVVNNDSTLCSPSDFSVTPALPFGFTRTPEAIVHTLAAQTSASGTLIISVPAGVSSSSNLIPVTMQNISSPVYKNSASVKITVLPPDLVPPVITITKPADNAVFLTGSVKIAASAKDPSGVAEVKIFLDGALLKTCYVASCSVTTSANALSAGSHTIVAEATDKAGPTANTASASVTIVKQ